MGFVNVMFACIHEILYFKHAIGPDKQYFERKIVISFLPIIFDVLLSGCSKELYPQQLFLLRNKEYAFLSRGLAYA